MKLGNDARKSPWNDTHYFLLYQKTLAVADWLLRNQLPNYQGDGRDFHRRTSQSMTSVAAIASGPQMINLRQMSQPLGGTNTVPSSSITPFMGTTVHDPEPAGTESSVVSGTRIRAAMAHTTARTAIQISNVASEN
jgi:hypothetical protein